MNVQFKMKHPYPRGIDKIKGHIPIFVNLRHIRANQTVTYDLWDSNKKQVGQKSGNTG